MKQVRNILKWILKAVIVFLALIILVGLTLRLVEPAPKGPDGELVDVGGFKLHVLATGERNNKPTVVMESGAGLPLPFFHWIDQGLRDSVRVVRYERAGMGHSDKVVTPRDPETVAKELHTLLENTGESPPYIMVGHSMGAPYILVFGQMYKEEVEGLIFLDGTHHEQVERFGAPEASSFKFKLFNSLNKLQAVAADLGLFLLYEKVSGNPYKGVGLPDELNEELNSLLASGKSFRAYQKEMSVYQATLKRSGEASDYGDKPIRSFTAVKDQSALDELKKKKDYVDFEHLSTNGKEIGIIGGHTTIFTKKENAQIICDEILEVARELTDN